MTILSMKVAKSMLLGILAAIVAAFICALSGEPTLGHRIDMSKLTPEAKSIVAENPGVPITVEQWGRLDKAMARGHGWPTGMDIFRSSVQKNWYFFFLLPFLFTARNWIKSRELQIFSVIALFSPSALLVVYAFLTDTSVLK